MLIAYCTIKSETRCSCCVFPHVSTFVSKMPLSPSSSMFWNYHLDFCQYNTVIELNATCFFNVFFETINVHKGV